MPDNACPDNYQYSMPQKLELLQNKDPQQRTLAARLLANSDNYKVIAALCKALEKEKSLYTKLEICKTLATCKDKALLCLIPILGQIGHNQHKVPDTKPWKKKSFPLPRDIVARIMIRMGEKALPALECTINLDDPTIVSEALDAYGFVNFYAKKIPCTILLDKCRERFASNALILWKIKRIIKAFPELGIADVSSAQLALSNHQQSTSNKNLQK